MKKSGLLLGCLGLFLVGLVIFAMFGVGTYNNLVRLDEGVKSQWAQVENQYQRRFDLIPNLVRTVQGAANFEKGTLEAVVEARSRVGQVGNTAGGPPGTAPDPTGNPQAFQQFEQAQAGLTSALSRLLVVVERYPELKANQNFLQLQSELEGTENRISVERRRYNEVAEQFNATVRRFPASLIAGFLGFRPKEYFKGSAGSEKPPDVNFDFNKK
ncbi:MAG TPA: LemA family protein [Thermoanaerobaculia bacterium]|nr:LemA family protein [Thermoanaerobaculia bacterium]